MNMHLHMVNVRHGSDENVPRSCPEQNVSSTGTIQPRGEILCFYDPGTPHEHNRRVEGTAELSPVVTSVQVQIASWRSLVKLAGLAFAIPGQPRGRKSRDVTDPH